MNMDWGLVVNMFFVNDVNVVFTMSPCAHLLPPPDIQFVSRGWVILVSGHFWPVSLRHGGDGWRSKGFPARKMGVPRPRAMDGFFHGHPKPKWMMTGGRPSWRNGNHHIGDLVTWLELDQLFWCKCWKSWSYRSKASSWSRNHPCHVLSTSEMEPLTFCGQKVIGVQSIPQTHVHACIYMFI